MKLNSEQVDFLRRKIYPFIDESKTDAVRPEGEPPLPEILDRESHPEWSEFIGSMCVDYEVSAAQSAHERQSILSKDGEIAVELVNILYAG
ncbi:MAG: hypothetical protein QM308_05860 [Bacillota bacterium]|nr:hypothetical protein [Bacillota bacterium]